VLQLLQPAEEKPTLLFFTAHAIYDLMPGVNRLQTDILDRAPLIMRQMACEVGIQCAAKK